tara:strand:+ start:2571 stop:2735 length:165 start_codon:yes stop_codon:yes gene_type:complete
MIINIIHFILFFMFFAAFQLVLITILDKIMGFYIAFVNNITFQLSKLRGNDEKS